MKPKPIHYLITTSLLIMLCEILIQYLDVRTGIIAHILVLIFLIVLFTSLKNIPVEYTHVFQIMTLIPLYRIISLSIPIELITYEGYLIATTIIILYGSLVLIKILKIPFNDVGLVLKNIKLQIICIAAGGVIGYLEWKFIDPSGLELLIPAIPILTLCALTDELICRGLIQQSIDKAETNSFFAILLTSTLYTIFFISYFHAPELILIFLTSLFYGYVVLKSKSIVGVSLSHAMVNISCFVIFPYWL